MKKTLILITLSFLYISTIIAQSQTTKADQLLEKLITEKKVIGASAGYSINGVIKWQAAVGHANIKNQQKFELSTITRTASIAKPMTALAVLQLVEQGLLKLDDPIDTYIPDFPKKGENKITIRYLLSHTSGITGYKNYKEAENKINYPTLSAAMNVFKDRALKFEPGTRYSYSTYGYVVLGVIIEKVSGLTFEEYMQQHIWNKAGMKNTGVEKVGTEITNYANLYHHKGKGKIKSRKQNNLSNRIPGGGFYSNIEDMLKFGNAVLNHTLVKESTLNLMIEHHSLEKEANAYGFGWFLYGKKPIEGSIIGHTGEQTGVSAQLFIVPQTKTVIAVLSNTSGSLRTVTTLGGHLIQVSEVEE